MPISNQRLGELLSELGVITIAKFKELEAVAEKSQKDVTDVLLANEIMHDEELGEVLADETGFPFVNLRLEKISPTTLHLIPEAVSRTMGVIILREKQTV